MSHDFNVSTSAGFLLRFWIMWWLNIPAYRWKVLPPSSGWTQSTNMLHRHPKDTFTTKIKGKINMVQITLLRLYCVTKVK